ncbi:MAG: hypothetical protein GWM88_05955 [Pseudomonadales bacterium]|nr:hypothetical protein [Pseudomonadales bacterium]NIX07572.1 hypothetical protein [Pseudomonadales bacterium]
MTTVLGILGFAALFAAFGLLAPVLARKRCNDGGCASCSSATECKYSE